jgi:hypothetical protein
MRAATQSGALEHFPAVRSGSDLACYGVKWLCGVMRATVRIPLAVISQALQIARLTVFEDVAASPAAAIPTPVTW